MYGIISEELIIRNFQKAQLSVIGRHNVTTHTLRLFTDLYAPGENASPLPPVARVLYVVAGGITVRASSVTASLDPNSAWQGSVTPQVVAGKSGARVLRWELVRSNLAEDTHARASAESVLTLQSEITLSDPNGVLMRCDRVDFPKGGEALTHVHQGPGIRCLLTGDIRIDTHGSSTPYGVGQAWFEAGPDPVYAAASAHEPTGFARVMILPRSCQGKSSIRYVLAEDADKPKSQKYQIFADEFIDA